MNTSATDKQVVEDFLRALEQRSIQTPRFSDGWPYNWQLTANCLRAAYKHRVQREGLGPYREPQSLLANYEVIAKWVTEGRTPGIIFNGGIGNGKTTMAKALGDLIGVNTATFCKVVSAVDYSRAVAQDNPIVVEYAKHKLLLVDDIGTEAVSVKAYGTEYLPIAELIYTRYNDRSATICTTNLTHEQFNGIYGERVADRVKQVFDWVSFRESSYR